VERPQSAPRGVLARCHLAIWRVTQSIRQRPVVPAARRAGGLRRALRTTSALSGRGSIVERIVAGRFQTVRHASQTARAVMTLDTLRHVLARVVGPRAMGDA
jgi:hypothetical protein